MEESNLETLLSELSSFKFETEVKKELIETNPTLREENVDQYVLDKAKRLIETGVAAVQDIASSATQSSDPEEISALANLMDATTKALEVLNKKVLANKRTKDNEILKKLDIEGRKEIALLQSKQQVNNNMNVLVASREEIFHKLFGQRAETIEILDSNG